MNSVTPALVLPDAVNVASALGSLKMITFDGINGAGACTAVGAVVGDVVIAVTGLTSGALGSASASFESTITTVDEIQQSSESDLSTKDYVALLFPAG